MAPLVLPVGFKSWTQVLIDWSVSRAFTRSRLPGCLADRPELAAPFVAEIGAALRAKLLHQRATEAALIALKVIEPAYDEAGGPDYLKIRDDMEASQERFFAAWLPVRKAPPNRFTPELASLRADMERHQAAFARVRDRVANRVAEARQAAVRAHWKARHVRGIPDTFFADATEHSAQARMQRIHPPWWGAFMGRLQKLMTKGHPAEGKLLDELPQLRAKAKKKTIEGVIRDWREEHSGQWAWYEKAYDRVLAERAAVKAEQLTVWFNQRTPGYLAGEAVRFSLHAELAERLVAADPWAVATPLSGLYTTDREHWRN